jgi:hypothetical protein
MSEVSPRAELAGEGRRFVDGRDPGRVVRPDLGEFGQLNEHDRGAPHLAERAEGGQGLLAEGFVPLDPAEDAAERAPQQRHRCPTPRIRRGRVPVERDEGAIGITVVQNQHRLG